MRPRVACSRYRWSFSAQSLGVNGKSFSNNGAASGLERLTSDAVRPVVLPLRVTLRSPQTVAT